MTLPSHGSSSVEANGTAQKPVAGRFQIERSIGRGGMASVYEVTDLQSGERRALKRLHRLDEVRKQRRAVQLFEREFHTLAHLAHPRVVEVYDYGIDDDGPYYTMELLDGGDLHQHAPVPWLRACAHARDIASALSLLHSRRMVYRDLSARNVRCTSDGRAKLIDFGAMSMMGPSKQVVGTPAYCAPEALNLQPLDARTDLFSLGATLYYTLTGRHAFPSRDFKQLREAWRSRVVPPSSIVLEIPASLDALVLDLLHLEPSARPENAAEVMERLAAIEGRALEEHLLVSQAYLSTPNLIGREAPLARARAKVMRAIRGRGGAVFVRGGAGVGRTRFVHACLLEAKLSGGLTLRADSADVREDYGVARALFLQLLEAMPELALEHARPRLGLLAHAVPELLAREPTATLAAFESPERIRAQLQPALREWLLSVSTQRPLIVAVDDMHAIDEPSAAFLALLARDVKRRAVLLITSAESAAPASSPSAIQLFAEAATNVELGPLSAEQSEKLFRSVFGDVPYVQQLAHRLHTLAGGNPRDMMQLAQHLLDKQLVRYRAGAWSLPASIAEGELPANMAQAQRQRIDALSPVARQLAQTIALCPERSVSFDECLWLCERDEAAMMHAIDELIAAQLLVMHASDSYRLARRDFVPALADGLDGETRKLMHRRVARMFETRGDDGFRVARHLLLAGEDEQGVAALIAHADASQRSTDGNPDAFTRLVQSMPADWFDYYETGLRLCTELDRPRRDRYTIENRLGGVLGLIGEPNHEHFLSLIELLRRESGLADWHALDPAMDPMQRLQKALEATQARYEGSTDHERVLQPIDAIRQLARTAIAASGLIATALDYTLLKALPSLEPLAPLSPALVAVGLLVRGLGARMTGRFEEALRMYVELLRLLGRPEGVGLDASHHRHTQYGVLRGLGMTEASLGLQSCLERAAAIEESPLHQANALLIRMLYHLSRGQARDADQCKEQVELLRIQNSARAVSEGTHLLSQIVLNAAADDLTRIKQTIDEVEVLAARYPNWVPVRHYAIGEYHRIRGDHASAMAAFDRALELTAPGCDQLWANTAGARCRALCDADRYGEARSAARAYLAQADAAGGLGGAASNWIKMPLALSEAKLGAHDVAISEAVAVLDNLRRLGTQGVILALALETRARVAIAADEKESFEHYASLYADQLRLGASRVLSVKYERLKQEAARARMELSIDLPQVDSVTEPVTMSHMSSIIDACRGATERARAGLALLLRSSGASAGFLFTLTDAGPELSAKLGDHLAPARMIDTVRDYLDSEIRTQVVRTQSMAPESEEHSEITGSYGQRYRMMLLSHPIAAGFAITGVAVAVVEPGERFVYPGPTATQLSRILLESGDISPATVTDE